MFVVETTPLAVVQLRNELKKLTLRNISVDKHSEV